MKPHPTHYVLSTHWDREWYQHFQDYRYRLVQLIDRLLAGWRDGRLQGPFQTDGQAILLEDYLEIRPERRAEVEQRAREGKFVIGPWYVLPDEFLVSGESLVRNLQFGRRAARSFGVEPSNAGFLCDMFGHNSQMPQIFAGFGIRGALLWRGTNLVDQRLFRWRGADGSEQLTYRFGLIGYCDYSRRVRASHQKNLPFDREATRHDFETFLAGEAQMTPASTLLLFDGGDHMEWDADVYEVLLEQMDRPDNLYEIKHTSLDAYLADLLAEAPAVERVIQGELREPARPPSSEDHQWLIPGVLSSRVWIKQQNAACQALLCQWAEPFSALARQALGLEYPQGYLNTAWKWLLMNHPHDSICGCSIDAVHEDMKFRFAQARVVANRLASEATRKITASVAGEVAPDELRVGVFNPLAVELNEPVELALEIPPDWPTSGESMGGFEPMPAFRVYAAGGEEIPYQRLAQAMNRKRFRLYDTGFPKGYTVNEVRVSLPLRIPATGYTTLTVRSARPEEPTRHALRAPDARGAPEGVGESVAYALATSERSLENEFLAVTVEPNGSLTLHDKRSGQVYTRLLTFEDCADIGDGWNHGPATNDQVFTTTASAASVALVHKGPHLGTLRIRATLETPAAFDFGEMARRETFEKLVIDSTVSLRAGQPRLEVETTVLNTARDHRLRALFPSGAAAATYLSDSPFDVVERPIALRADNHLYREMEVETKPQQTWTAVFDGERGLAVISTGLLETAVLDTPERILALTLFRATGRTVFTNGEPEGQLQGTLRFRYWLAPLNGAPDRAVLCRLGQQVEAGLRAAQVAPADQFIYNTGIPLPLEGGLLAVEGPVVVTSAQLAPAPAGARSAGSPTGARSALEVRFFNPSEAPAAATLRPAAWQGQAWKQAQWVNLDGVALRAPLGGAATGAPVALEQGALKVEVPPKKILTVQFS